MAAPNREAARLNPHMERFRQKGIEVLYLFEPIDEFVMDGLGRYKEWEFKSVEAASDDALKDFADKEEPAREAVAPLSGEDSTSFEGLLGQNEGSSWRQGYGSACFAPSGRQPSRARFA